MADFNKVGLLVTDGTTFLVCRKKDYTSQLIMPGGQLEPGESEIDCLKRECREELGEHVELHNIRDFGVYEDKAAADDPTIEKTVRIHLFQADLIGSPSPNDEYEIAELVWFGPYSPQKNLSPIIANKILPDLLARGVIHWNKK